VKYGLSFKDSFSMLHFKLDKNESIVAGSDAMAYMDTGIRIKPFMQGGFLQAFTRKFMGKESAFLNRYVSIADNQEIGIVSNAAFGSVSEIVLDGNMSLKVRPGGFLAAWEEEKNSIDVSGSIGGIRTYMGMEGFEFLDIKGEGLVFITGFGGIYKREIVGGELIVDTGHVLAYTSNLDFSIKPVGGLKSTFLSGEGLVCRFRGVGFVWIQSRNTSAFVNFLRKILIEEEQK